MIDMNALRAFQARGKAAWFAGIGKHPQGLSGERWIVPLEESRNMWDTHPRGRRFSEWGNAAAAVDHDDWRGLPLDAVAFVLASVPVEDRGPEWRRLSDLVGHEARDALTQDQRDRLHRIRKARK